MKKIAIIIPSRERSHKIKKLHSLWFNTLDEKISTDCIIALDEDNECTYERLPNFIYEIVKPHPENIRGVTYPLNQVAIKYCNEYEYIGFMGDDHIPITKNWNSLMYEVLNKNKPYSMVYGNDLFHCANLPTQIIMDSLYIKYFGYMIDPLLYHLYSDNYWLYIGHYIKKIHYLEDVIIEHEHCFVNKSKIDDMYIKLNNKSCYVDSEKIFLELIKDGSILNKQLDKLLDILNKNKRIYIYNYNYKVEITNLIIIIPNKKNNSINIYNYDKPESTNFMLNKKNKSIYI